MKLRWKIVNYADALPAGFSSRGLVSSDNRFFVGSRYVNSSGAHANWGAIDFVDEVYRDGFAYRRDAKAFVESEWVK